MNNLQIEIFRNKRTIIMVIFCFSASELFDIAKSSANYFPQSFKKKKTYLVQTAKRYNIPNNLVAQCTYYEIFIIYVLVLINDS